jgi:hypothetical protein
MRKRREEPKPGRVLLNARGAMASGEGKDGTRSTQRFTDATRDIKTNTSIDEAEGSHMEFNDSTGCIDDAIESVSAFGGGVVPAGT